MSSVTTGPLELSNRCRFVDQCSFTHHAGMTLERAGWVPLLDARDFEEKHRLFVQFAFTEPQSFL
jgi:hypothetical protein